MEAEDAFREYWRETNALDKVIIAKAVETWRDRSNTSGTIAASEPCILKVMYPEVLRGPNSKKTLVEIGVGVSQIPISAIDLKPFAEAADQAERWNMIMLHVYRPKGPAIFAISKEALQTKKADEFILYQQTVEKLTTIDQWLKTIEGHIRPPDMAAYKYKCKAKPIGFAQACNKEASEQEDFRDRHTLVSILIYIMHTAIPDNVTEENSRGVTHEEALTLSNFAFMIDVRCGTDHVPAEWQPKEIQEAIRQELLEDYEKFMAYVEAGLEALNGHRALLQTFIHFASLLYAYNNYMTLGEIASNFSQKIIDITQTGN